MSMKNSDSNNGSETHHHHYHHGGGILEEYITDRHGIEDLGSIEEEVEE